MRIGIFGGSFNPIHVGHISLAKQLLRLAELDEVWLMVSPQNPLKQGDTDLLDDRMRYQMARIAVHGEAGIVASDYELHLPKPSYTWNTLQKLRADEPDNTFVLLIGGDNWQLFSQWYRADDILRNYQIVVYPRRGSSIDKTLLPANVTVVDTELLDISSTEVRKMARKGRDFSMYVPPSIVPLVRRYWAKDLKPPTTAEQ